MHYAMARMNHHKKRLRQSFLCDQLRSASRDVYLKSRFIGLNRTGMKFQFGINGTWTDYSIRIGRIESVEFLVQKLEPRNLEW